MFFIGEAVFVENVRGCWCFCVTITGKFEQNFSTGSVGFDLGLIETATLLHGAPLKARYLFCDLERTLAITECARKTNRVRAIPAKTRNRLHDGLHKISRGLFNQNAVIFVVNVSSSMLVKTNMLSPF